MKDIKTPDKMPWLKRIYGETISPREIIITAVAVLLFFGIISGYGG